MVTSGQFLLDPEASLAGIDIRPVGGAGSAANQEDEEQAEFTATGVVASIADGRVTLRHGPVPALEWPAMTMAFATQGPAQVRGLKAGDRVTFTFVQADSRPRIVAIERTGQ